MLRMDKKTHKNMVISTQGADNQQVKVEFGRKLIGFGYNYPHDFINQVWAHNETLVDHFNSKLRNGKGFFDFFMNLSSNNQRLLLNWIDENYNF